MRPHSMQMGVTMQKDTYILDTMTVAFEQITHLIELGADELMNADRLKRDGSRNYEVDRAHTTIMAVQRLLEDIADLLVVEGLRAKAKNPIPDTEVAAEAA